MRSISDFIRLTLKGLSLVVNLSSILPTDRWNLIKIHWYDMIWVVLSLRAGKVMPSTWLRKLGSYSRKNRLEQAFLGLGLFW